MAAEHLQDWGQSEGALEEGLLHISANFRCKTWRGFFFKSALAFNWCLGN